MIVQPTPTQRPARRSRARLIAGLVVPPVLLAAVVAAGFAGPRAEGTPAASPVALAPGDPAAEGAAPPAARPGLAIPAMFGDLVAVTPSEDLDGDPSLRASDAVAVAGFLGLDAAESACNDRPGAPFGSWCDRRGILAQAPWSSAGMEAFPAHLRVHVPPGVPLPEVIDHATSEDHLDPMPVLVVGRRAVRPAACQGWGPAICDDEFVVDRVVWADGVRMGLTPLVDERLAGERRPNPFMTALDLADVPLLAALVWPEDVWRLDSDAGRVAIEATAGEPVWYLRVLDGARSPGMERRVRWMLLSERDLRVLASGRPGEAPGTASGAGA